MKATEALYFSFLGLLLGILIGFAIQGDHDKRETRIIEEVSSELTEWELMKLAIIKTESEYDTLAVGKSEDWGIFQITPIYVMEVNRILGEDRYIHEDAFNPNKSIEMFNVMQERHNPKRDIDRAISLHNPLATSAYSVKVRRNMEEIRKYEDLRKIVR